MFKRILIVIWNALLSLRKKFSNSYNKLRYFYIPNWKLLFNNSVLIHPSCSFSQKTKFTGLGKITVYEKCHFGYISGGFHSGPGIEIQARTMESSISIGAGTITNNNIFICSSGKIEVGENCLIGQGVSIMDFEAHGISPKSRRKVGEVGFIKIENNVWIGNNVIILKNSIIGFNSIVGAGAVVTGEFPNNVILGGIPSKIIKSIPD